MTDDQAMMNHPATLASEGEKRGWEPMLLTNVGRLGDIMQGGGSSPTADGTMAMSMPGPG
jgi:hypothetical protein